MWSLKVGASLMPSAGRPSRSVGAGEVIVFTKGDAHVMSSSPGLRGDPFTPSVIDAATTSQLPLLINFGSTGPATKLVCGFLACDAQPFNPLLENLPPVIKAGDRNNRDTGWFDHFIRFAMMESAEKRVGWVFLSLSQHCE